MLEGIYLRSSGSMCLIADGKRFNYEGIYWQPSYLPWKTYVVGGTFIIPKELLRNSK